MKIDLTGKKALILGASKGLGEHLANVLSDHNCSIFLVARNEAKLLKIQESINQNKKTCYFTAINLLEDKSIDLLYSQLLKNEFIPDIVIHNLGGALGKKDPIDNRQSFFDVWNFNVGIQIELNNKLIPHMISNKCGRIISISSILSKNGGMPFAPFGGSIQYNAAKAYLNSYNKSLSRELAKFNIVVSTIIPGVLLSEGKYWAKLMVSNPKLVDEFLESHVSNARFGKYEEISPFILLLCSEFASYCAGLEINIDGGWK